MRNFRLDDDRWNSFRQECDRRGTTSSSAIVQFVEWFSIGGEVPAAEKSSPLNDRISAIEHQIGEILQTLSKTSSQNRLQRASKESSVRLDVQDGDKPLCPVCESSAIRREGRGKLRRDGSRSQRYFCRDCSKLWTIG